MKHSFIIPIFIFISVSLFGQPDSLIIGEYSRVEHKGLHFVPGSSSGDLHWTSYISHIDTIITHSLLLDTNHKAVLRTDTLFGVFADFGPKIKLLGQWKLLNDTLHITFSELLTLWPILVNGEKPTPMIETLTTQITQKFVLEFYDARILNLVLLQEELFCIYTKE
jgi:hypothetical protein